MSSVSEEDVLDEMHRIADKLDKQDITLKEWYEHKEISADVRSRFGTWNNAKQEAGLEINSIEKYGEQDKERINQAVKEVAENNHKKNTLANVAEESGYSRNTVTKFFDDVNDLFDGVAEPYVSNMSDKKLMNKVSELRQSREIVRPIDLEQIASRQRLERLGVDFDKLRKQTVEYIVEYMYKNYSHGFHSWKEMCEDMKQELGFLPTHHYRGFGELKEVFEDKYDASIRKSVPGGNNTKIYIDKGKYDSEDKYYRLMRQKWHNYQEEYGVDLGVSDYSQNKLFEVFIDFVGRGKPPKSIFASIAYLETEFSQGTIADRGVASEVTIRANYEDVAEELDKI